MKTEKAALRFCSDIGMWAVDRSRKSCRFATPFCARHCFNNKFYRTWKRGMHSKDIQNDEYWRLLNGNTLSETLSKKGNIRRFRFMTRGEAFSCLDDVTKIAGILAKLPKILFWIPTRAWRSEELRPAIERLRAEFPNARILASIDPTTTQDELTGLVQDNWSTMFFGDDSKAMTAGFPGFKMCPKTWKHKNGHCAKCGNGCFANKRVHIWLKQH